MDDELLTCAWYITYLAPFNALVCSEHGHALQVSKLDRHLQREHRLQVGQRQGVVRHYTQVAARATSHLAIDYGHLEDSDASPVAALRELAPPTDVYACQRCHYRCINLGEMGRHLGLRHQLQGQRGPQGQLGVVYWKKVKAQTFFQRTSERRWFEVSSTSSPPPQPSHADLTPSLKRFMDEAWEESEARRLAPGLPPTIDAYVHKSMDRPWLKKTKWLEHLDGIEPTAIISAASWLRPGVEGDDTLRFVARAGEQMLEESLSRRNDASEIALRHLANFSGSSDGQLNVAPFKGMQEKSTHTRYFHAWLRLIFFVIRISQGWLTFPRILFVLTDEQLAAVREVVHIAFLGDAMEDAEGRMKDALLVLSMSLVSHRLIGNRFDSAIVSYAAARGLSETTAVWLEPSSITSHLYGLIWCCQVVVLGYAFYRVEHLGSQHTVTEVIAKSAAKWLNNTKESPVMYLLTTNLYLRKVAMNTPAPAKVFWAEAGNTIYYEDFHMSMVELRSFCAALLDKAETCMVRDLLMNTEEDTTFLTELLPASQISALQESISTSNFGYSFLQVPTNNLSRLARFGKDKVSQSHFLWSSFFSSDPEGHHFNVHAGQVYQTKVIHFLELLAVLLLISGGSPPRASELVGLRWCNTDLRRDIYMHDGLAMFVTVYNKTQSMTDASKTIPRFMPLRVSRLFVLFVSAVQPFLQYLHNLEFGVGGDRLHSLAGTSFLFSSARGLPWAATKISQCLAHESSSFLGQTLTVASWRHISKAIIRRHLVAGDESSDPEDSSSDHNDVGDNDVAVWAAQAGHSERTGALVYGREVNLGSSLIWENIHLYRQSSKRLQSFLRLDKDIPGASATSPPHTTLGQPLPSADINFGPALAAIYGPGATFKSSAQSEACQQVYVNKTKEVVVVLPTGGGKSLLFMLGSFVDEGLFTLVVVPLRALLFDIRRQLARHGIVHEVWTQESSGFGQKVVLVSVDSVASSNFRTQLTAAYLNGQLARIVYDECHLAITQAHFRDSLRDLVNLRRLDSVQHVFLSATLPVSVATQFNEALALDHPVYVRTSTRRSNIGYSVLVCASVEEVSSRLVSCVGARSLGSAVIVYCRSKVEVDRVSGQLNCGGFYAGHADGEGNLRRWLDGEESVLVATGALGAGINQANVDLVIHLDAPWGLIDFAQESGRAGRVGQSSESIILTCKPWEARREQAAVTDWLRWSRNVREMHRYMVARGCRREVMDVWLDGSSVGPCTHVDPEEETCDNCNHLLASFDETWAEADVSDSVANQPPSLATPSRHTSNPLTSNQATSVHPATSRPRPSHFTTLNPLSLRNIANSTKIDSLKEFVLPAFGNGCYFCKYLLGRSEAHRTSTCPYHPAECLALSQIRITYSPYTACYSCGLPQSLCQSFDANGRTDLACEYPGLVVAFLAIAKTSSGFMGRLSISLDETYLETCELEAFVKWAGSLTFAMGLKCCFGFKVLVSLLEYAGKLD